MANYRCEYRYARRFGDPLHIWTCIGATAALHLHITEHTRVTDTNRPRHSGGLEIHWRLPQDGRPPDSDHCWLLQCPCWHDGSSLAATETWIPRWLLDPHDHDAMFRALGVRLTQEEEQCQTP